MESDHSPVVRSLSLDSFSEAEPNIIKIDVEGFEGQVLKGMQNLIAKSKPLIFMEVHPHLLVYGYTFVDLMSMLKEYREIKAFAEEKPQSILGKIRKYYLSSTGIIEIPVDQLKKSISAGQDFGTFWLVCQ